MASKAKKSDKEMGTDEQSERTVNPASRRPLVLVAVVLVSIIMVGWLGTIALASHQVMTTISQFTFMVYYGLGAAVAVRTSYFHGQRDVQNVRHTVTAGLHLMVMLEVVLGGTIFLLRLFRGRWLK